MSNDNTRPEFRLKVTKELRDDIYATHEHLSQIAINLAESLPTDSADIVKRLENSKLQMSGIYPTNGIQSIRRLAKIFDCLDQLGAILNDDVRPEKSKLAAGAILWLLNENRLTEGNHKTHSQYGEIFDLGKEQNISLKTLLSKHEKDFIDLLKNCADYVKKTYRNPAEARDLRTELADYLNAKRSSPPDFL